ncbi:hypothetical protein OG739_29115 [Streptomyces longwoodensis]|uniref:hypothetical protein n=1 Tax=Streptomyces longwoodensis TaxID=68231 RepID=UPI002DD99764|nr:hypothetical protein [Streptomyces longwoodensis]WRY91430.1 hypothetical protein OG481_24270 [Streptomyces longwoodensis]
MDADDNTIGSNGTRAQVWECLGTVQTNQHWRFEPATNQADVYGLRRGTTAAAWTGSTSNSA